MRHIGALAAAVLMSCTDAQPHAQLGTQLPDPQTLLAQVDVSAPGYGTATFGEPQVRVFRARDGSVLLTHHAQPGYECDHSAKRLKLFSFRDGRAQQVLDQSIDSIELVEEAGALKLIRGTMVESLCADCDDPSVAPPEDVFRIPIEIDVETRTVSAALREGEKNELLARVAARVAVHRDGPYGDDVAAAVAGRIKAVVDRR